MEGETGIGTYEIFRLIIHQTEYLQDLQFFLHFYITFFIFAQNRNHYQMNDHSPINRIIVERERESFSFFCWNKRESLIFSGVPP